MSVRAELSDKWVRAFVGETAVVNSRAPLLFWEETFPVPGYAFSRADVRTDLLRPATSPPPEQPFFFLPQGPVAQWYDLEVDGRLILNAAWTRDVSELADLIIFSWQPGLLDRWCEEEEEVAGHPRDPHKRVEALASSRHVVASWQGEVLADSTRAVLLFETDLPTRYYLPHEDVRLDRLVPSDNVSLCPYKGVADSYWSLPDEPEGANLAWSYSEPFPAVAKIKGRISFYNELVDITVDGEQLQRPASPFSSAANRPGSSAAA